MKETYKPAEYKEYRQKAAEEIKAIPKDETIGSKNKRRVRLEYFGDSPMYNYAKALHREERDYVKVLIEQGEVSSEEEAEKKWVEHVVEQEKTIEAWIENELCDPALVPEILIENKARLEMVANDIQENINKKLEILTEENPEIVELVDSYTLSQKEGTHEWDYYGERQIQNSSFLEAAGVSDISEEQKEQVTELRKDEQKLGLFLNELQLKKDKEIFSGCMQGWNYPTGGPYFVIAKRNLESIFDDEIPYETYVGDRNYRILPFGKSPIIESRIKGQYVKAISNYPEQLGLLAVYGKEDGQKMIDNLSATYRFVQNLEADRKIDKNLVARLGGDYMQVKEDFPELLEYARKTGNGEGIKDIDFENKVAVFLGGRSEYGSSGGVGYFSKIIVLAEGQDQEKEFQYRDRYSASKDDWSYNFSNLKIDSIRDEEGKLEITIDAKARESESKKINFSFERKTDEIQREELSMDKQLEFRNEVDEFISRLLSEKAEKISGKTRVDKMQGGYGEWNQPFVKELKVYAESGIAVFSVIENIDYGSPVELDMPQNRCELYLAEYGKGIKEIDRDHAYVVQVEHPSYESVKDSDAYGDPTMQNIEVKGNTITYSGRNGKKEYAIE